MRVMQIADAGVVGGLLIHVRTLTVGLLKAGHRVDVVVPGAPNLDLLVGELMAAGANVHRLRIRGKTDLRGFWRMRRLVAAARPEVVHVHLASPVEGVPALLAARCGGATRTLTTEHLPTYAPLRRFYSRAVKRAANRLLVDRVITVCRLDAGYLAREYRLNESKLQAIPNGIEGFTDLPSQEEARALLGLSVNAGLLVGYVGNLEPRKGIAELLQGSADSQVPGLILALAGDGLLRDELAEQATRLPFRLELLGRLPEVRTFLAALDVFILPSHAEAMPLALLEAMWAGLPIIATRVGGIPEVLEDGSTGLLLAPGEPGEIAAALRRLWQDPELAQHLGRTARSEAKARFGATRMVKEIAALYERLCSDGDDRPLPAAP